MKLVIDIPDEDEKAIRYAFQLAGIPASDAVLAEQCLAALLIGMRSVAASEARMSDEAAVIALKKRLAAPTIGTNQ